MNARTSPLCKRAPADLKKDAGGFDLPIALGLLLGSGQASFDRPGSFAIVGELVLTGEARPVQGVLAMALQAVAEKRDGLLVPSANAAEAAVVEGLNVDPIGSLAEAVGFLSGQVDMDPSRSTSKKSSASTRTWKKTSSTSKVRTMRSAPW